VNVTGKQFSIVTLFKVCQNIC